MRLPPLLTLLLLASACQDPARDAEALYARGDTMGAFRLAHGALAQPVKEEDRKRLQAVLAASATKVLDAPDDEDMGAALELHDGLPPETVVRLKASQRLLRVLARSRSPAELDAAYTRLLPEMGDEPEIRSNLRGIVDANLGRESAVWAARKVTTTWPDAWDRWLDQARAEAAFKLQDDAMHSLAKADALLHTFCLELPARMAAYDKVRRESAYGQLEVARCKAFGVLAAHALAWSTNSTSISDIKTRTVDVSNAAPVPCPKANPGAVSGPVGVLISPKPDAWWLDGTSVAGAFATVPEGAHVVLIQRGTTCLKARVELAAHEAVAIRTQPQP